MSMSHVSIINTEGPQKVRPSKDKDKITKAQLKYQRDKDRELVKGIFRFHEVPGAVLEFVYKKYNEDPLEKYTLVDGQIYSIPLGVAKHLNQNCWYPVHHYIEQESGPTMKVGQKVRRISFQSLEFVDMEDLTPQGSALLTVETAGV